MTISNQTNRYQYTGNGVTTGFGFSNVFFALTDLLVTLYDTTAMAAVAPAPVLNGSATYDYTITATLNADTGEYPSGTIVFNTAPPSNFRVTIERVVPQTQNVTLIDNSKFPAATVNGALDRLTLLVQRVAQLIGQALSYPSSDPSTTTNVLPGYQERASMFLAFDASGNPVASPGPSATGQPISAFWATTIQLGTAILSRIALGFSAIAAKGDLFVGSAANTIATLTAGANGTVPMARSASTAGLKYVAPFASQIYGLTYANGTDTTNDINIAAGGCMDSTGVEWIQYPLATKQLDVAWAADTGATPSGGLDTGSIGNSDYYIHVIKNPTSDLAGGLFSLSATSPTLPAGYTLFRCIGFMKRVGGTIVAMTTYETEGGGIEVMWTVPTLDVNLANTLTTARRTDAVKVPLNFSVTAHINALISDASAVCTAWIYCPDQTDAAPSAVGAPLSNIGEAVASGIPGSTQLKIRTSAAGLIAARASLATVDLYCVSTMGFAWARR